MTSRDDTETLPPPPKTRQERPEFASKRITHPPEDGVQPFVGDVGNSRDEEKDVRAVTWHALRHTFASRLVVAGVDLRTVQELGGWKTLSMVQRYAHMSPGHLTAAVEKIVAAPTGLGPRIVSAAGLRENFDSAATASRKLEVRH